MKSIFALVCAGAVCVLANPASAEQVSRAAVRPDVAFFISCAGAVMPTLDQLTRDAVSENRTIATNAIRSLRARGPEGLRALLETHAETLKQHDANRNRPAATVQPDESWQRLKAALDGVSKQRDCFASKLFWYTDFESAKAAARAADKPILSLRLLGQLDEEFSCANSRFFRTTLYANAEVARFLNDYFILHWKSVRPVPKVTIDFGDGRKLERTLTGNSIHYVLDAEGRVIDALPGLYGAQTFLRELHRAEDATRAVAKLTDEPRQSALRDFHRTRLLALNSEYAADLQRLSAPTPVRFETTAATSIVPGAQPPTAQAAGRLAGGKRRVEMPILKRTANATDNDDAIWQRIGDLHTDTARVDESARALIREKAPTAIAAAQFTRLKAFVENPVLRQIRNLERSISEDTARNEYLFHTRIHDWLANGAAPAEVDKLNTKVYAELFLTPDSDPWLGLLPNDTFAALENDGITVTTKR